MQFNLRNVGLIKEASIKLDGLTVITGLNDCGKSIIGKTIFGVIKTINESNNSFVENRKEEVQEVYQRIRFSLPNQINDTSEIRELLRSFFSDLLGTEFFLENVERFAEESFIIQEKIKTSLIVNKSNELVDRSVRNKEFVKRVDNYFSKLREILSEKLDFVKSSKDYFNGQVIRNLFQGQLNSLLVDESAQIEYGSKEVVNTCFIVENNKVVDIQFKDEFNIRDATLIETPTILQLSEFINQSVFLMAGRIGSRRNRRLIPFHYYDLVSKILVSKNYSDLNSELSISISKIISGEVYYNSELSSFVYKSSNGTEVKSNNIATGIKSLGLLQLLINSEYINESSLLIIDEPEVHLHPQWQYEYAKILLELVKNNIKVIISTHSPYFIETIEQLSRKAEFENKVNFYFGYKNQDQSSTFSDVTSNLNDIYKALAAPMQRLAFEN